MAASLAQLRRSFASYCLLATEKICIGQFILPPPFGLFLLSLSSACLWNAGVKACDQYLKSSSILSGRNRRTGTIFDLPRFSGSPPGYVQRATKPFPVFRPTAPCRRGLYFFTLVRLSFPILARHLGSCPTSLHDPCLSEVPGCVSRTKIGMLPAAIVTKATPVPAQCGLRARVVRGWYVGKWQKWKMCDGDKHVLGGS